MQADQLGQVSSGDKPEVFISNQRRNPAEAATGEKYGGWAQHQVQVFGMRDDGQKDEQGKRVGPPKNSRCGTGISDRKGCQVGHHQEKDQQRDHAGFIGNFRAEPTRAHQEPADEKPEDSKRAGYGKGCGYIEIESPDRTLWVEESEAKADCNVIQGDQCEGAESPENKGVGQSGQGALADDFSLAKHFPEEVPHPLTYGCETKIGVLFGLEDALENGSESPPEKYAGSNNQCHEKQLLPRREALRFSQRGREEIHIRTHSQYTIRPLVGRSPRDR